MEAMKGKMRRSSLGLWRSYSAVLTVVVLFMVSFVGASSANISKWATSNSSSSLLRFYNGVLQSYTSSGWKAYTGTNMPALLNLMADVNGTALAAAGGGMSLEEWSAWYKQSGNLSSELQRYLYADPAFDQYLDRDGQIKTAVSTSGVYKDWNLATMLANSLMGINTNLLKSADRLNSTTALGFSVSHSDMVSLSDTVSGFKDANHEDLSGVRSDITSGFSVNHEDLTSGFSVNHQDLDRVNKSLVGSGSASAVFWDSTTTAESAQAYTNVLSAISSLGSSMQNDLAKLRYVLASDQDIEIAKKQEPVKGSVEDNFVGDSPAAVKPGDVDDMAGFSGNFQDAFSTGANAGDALGAVTDPDSWLFWSEAVASDLNRVPAAMADDEDDFIHFYDPSALEEYLSGGDRS